MVVDDVVFQHIESGFGVDFALDVVAGVVAEDEVFRVVYGLVELKNSFGNVAVDLFFVFVQELDAAALDDVDHLSYAGDDLVEALLRLFRAVVEREDADVLAVGHLRDLDQLDELLFLFFESFLIVDADLADRGT